MPNLDLYKKINNTKTIGQAHKQQSDAVMESTWYNDIDSRIGWFYDQYHDDEFNVLDGLNPETSKTKIPIEIKFFEMEYNSLAKDEVAYHIMFKPSYEPNIPYYEEQYSSLLGSHFPVGLYCDIQDSFGIYHRWLVVGQYREYSNQFPTYLVIPCDYKLQWIYENTKMESWAVLRSQSSYNSGLWTADRSIAMENQKIAWLPYNDITKTIFYDVRLAISQARDIPVVWKVSKVEDMNVRGIARYTMAQDSWQDYSDYIECDEDGNVVGIWCNYYSNDATPSTPIEEDNIYCKISYKGVQNNQLKIKGTARIFDVTFYKDNEQIPYQDGTWSFEINGQPADDVFTLSPTSEGSMKAKFVGSDDYLGQTVKVIFTSGKLSDSIEMNIVGN